MDVQPLVKRDLKAIALREVLTIFDAISNQSDNPFPPQSKRLTGREGRRLRVGTYRVICTVSSRDITLFVVKIAHRKKNLQMIFTKRSQSHFLMQMHDKASYQLLSLAEVAVGFALGFALTLI